MKCFTFLFLFCFVQNSLPHHHHGNGHHSHESNSHEYGDGILVTYTTWVADKKPIREKSIVIDAPDGTTMFDVMVLAANQRPKDFMFNTTTYEDLHLVTSIGGVEQNPTTSYYWKLYVLNRKPNVKRPPTVDQQSAEGMFIFLMSKKLMF